MQKPKQPKILTNVELFQLRDSPEKFKAIGRVKYLQGKNISYAIILDRQSRTISVDEGA